MTAQAPRSIDVRRLRAWAREWDVEGDGACWPATKFVEWCERNLRDRADYRVGNGVRAAAQLRDRGR